MTGFTQFLLTGVGFLAGIYALRIILVLHSLLRLRLQAPSRRLVAVADVPPHVREGLEPAIADLRARGFEEPQWAAGVRTLQSRRDAYHFAWLHHPQERAFAEVRFADLPSVHDLSSITFVTFGQDGRSLRTINGCRHAWLGALANERLLNDPYAATIGAQWTAHGDAVRHASLVPAPLDSQEAFARAEQLDRAELEEQLAQREAFASPDGAIRLTWRTAIRYALRMVAGTQRLQALNAERLRAVKASRLPPPAPPVEEEIAAYERFDELTREPPRRSFTVAVFGGTAVLFCASMAALSANAAATAAILFGVVLFHELGHWAAMRLFGYRNTTIFFVPFLGGATAGRKHDATIGQEMIVLLAGPLPGLIVAAVAALAGAARVPALNRALWTLVILNLLNLLPILPLDGGRIAHALLFARVKWLDAAARVFGVVAFALLGVALSSPLVGVSAAVIALTIPQSFRQAALRKRFHAAAAGRPVEDWPGIFFRLIRDGGRDSLPFAKKLGLARGVLVQATQNASPGVGPAALWLSAYAGAFVVGLFAVGALVTGGLRTAVPPSLAHESRTIAALSCPSAGWHEPGLGEAPSTPSPRLAGLGVFAGADSARSATQDAPGGRAAALERVVFFGADPAAGSADDDFEDEPDVRAAGLAAAAEKQQADSLEKLVAGRGGEWFPGVRRVSIACRARDEETARHLQDEVLDQSWASTSGVPPPWRVAASGELLRARRTFRLAHEAMTAPGLGSSRWAAFRAIVAAFTRRRGAEDAAARKARLTAQVDAALSAERTAGAIDEQVARLVVAHLAAESNGERQAAARELGARLGAAEKRPPDWLWLGRAGREHAQLTVPFTPSSLSSLEAELPALVGWLCSRGCAEPSLQLAEAPKRVAARP